MSFESCLPWGWNNFLETFYNEFCDSNSSKAYEPGRVFAESHGLYSVICPRIGREFLARVSGRLQHQAAKREDYPAVGDWVCVDSFENGGEGRISHILPRRTYLKRKSAGEGAERQMLAAQIDETWIVSSCNQDLSPERLERAILLATEGGARARVLLSKSDLVKDDELQALVTNLETRLVGVEVMTFSSRSGKGVAELRQLLKLGETAVVVGSSGVGKSTLLNILLGEDVLRVQEIRHDDAKGRHTTTGRYLHRVASGGLVIDTPGTRELQIFSDPDALVGAFSDIVTLESRCKFSDCAHESEIGCAIKQALQEGELSQERWQNYLKLGREMAFQQRRNDKGLESREKKRWAKISAHASKKSRMKGRS